MEVLWETLGFAAKAAVVVFAALVTAASIFGMSRRRRPSKSVGTLEVSPVLWRRRAAEDALQRMLMRPDEFKRHIKERNQSDKARYKTETRARAFVLEFKGDLMASPTERLREEISTVLGVARPGDEVIVRLESGGGAVSNYGLASSQLERVRRKGVRLVVCVDRIAASGGYMMACVADEICAAPFAVLGSIGVAAPVPNVHRLLKEHGVDYREYTAGAHKRTLSMLGEITPQGQEKFQEQLDEVHTLFKDHVQQMRPKLVVSEVATGEHWYGTRALTLGLVDKLITSDDYIIEKGESSDVYEVTYDPPRSLTKRLAFGVGQALSGALGKSASLVPSVLAKRVGALPEIESSAN